MDSGYLIKDMPLQDRPRERLVRQGAKSLSNAELVAILLRVGSKGTSVVQVAQHVLKKFGTLHGVAAASLDDLRQVSGVGPDKAVALQAAFELAERMVREVHAESPMLDRPAAIADFLRETVREARVEEAHVILLNTRRRLIRVEQLTKGTLDTLLVHPREVFRSAIVTNASALVLVHNHPSGDPTPSEADIKITRDLVRVGQVMRIEVLDHVILGRATAERPQDWLSLRELGYFYT